MNSLITESFQRVNGEWVISGNIRVEVEDVSRFGASYTKTMVSNSEKIRVATYSLNISLFKPNWLNLMSDKGNVLIRVSENTIVRFFDDTVEVAEIRLKDLPKFVRGDDWIRPIR